MPRSLNPTEFARARRHEAALSAATPVDIGAPNTDCYVLGYTVHNAQAATPAALIWRTSAGTEIYRDTLSAGASLTVSIPQAFIGGVEIISSLAASIEVTVFYVSA